MLADQLRAFPVIPVIGDGCYRLQPIHAADVAAGFVKSLAIPQTIGRIYELCGSQRMSYVELLDAVAEALGRSRPLKLHLPLMLMKPLVHALQGFAAFPVTSDNCRCYWRRISAAGRCDIFGLHPGFADRELRIS
jgi:NADH dehydrogenase